ncbi:hypothetical protein RHMOL_Rhmol01G0031100 [Rhododendron molle]|uniref:Uncharacterized protein n=1 Tax=Rhododendron molle TaxID=49168 RepID=A0ACC0PZF2_RHOML|nr:hypothetical protein RHMOL_Rhmol01G0031100 [Rhododendron molle]
MVLMVCIILLPKFNFQLMRRRTCMKSVIDYFQEVYGFTIRHSHLPCLLMGSARKVNYLPMEACKIVEGQRYSKRLNDKQITSLLKFSCQRAKEQEAEILQTIHQKGYNEDPYAKEFGIIIDDNLASVEARVLPAPWLKYNDNGKDKEFLPKVGQWNMTNKEFNFEPVIPIHPARPDKVVASQDWPEVTKYAGLVCAQPHRQELIQDLYKTWQDPKGGTITGGMIRDGVSDGQFYQVLLYELDAIRKACASLEPSYQPPVTFIVVQKRHHTRLFANNHNDKSSTDKSGNILPGTPVDTKICHPTEFDFYLCSHAGIQLCSVHSICFTR